MNSPPVREQTVTTRAIQLIPFMSGLTALASPSGMSVYWVTNAALSLVQSVTVRNKLRDEGLDMWEMDRLQKEQYEREAQMSEQQRAMEAAREAERIRKAEEQLKIQAKRERELKEKEERKRLMAEQREKALEAEKKKKEGESKAQP